MAQTGSLNFRGFIQRRDRFGDGVHAPASEDGNVERQDSLAKRSYAFAPDRTTRLAFSRMKPIEIAVGAAVRLFGAVGKAQLLGQAVKVGPNQFPRVYRIVERCAETLGISVPTVYIVNNPTMNAAAYGTNQDSFVLLHSATIDRFSDAELEFIIGHECGHIHNAHVVYLTAMFYVHRMASVVLKGFALPLQMAMFEWLRSAEITCDRAGLLCCRDLGVGERTLTKLALGSSKLFDELNMEAFIDQVEEARGQVGRYAEMGTTHPFLPKRVLALRRFADSALYRKHTVQGEGGLSIEQVDEHVREVVRVA